MERWDVVVVGGGAMGAAAAWQLARRGRRTLLLDRFEPGHARGSSHGSHRVFRLGYEEDDYIRLGRTALDGWRELEAATGASLLELTGVIDHGPAAVIAPVVDAFGRHGVVHEVLAPDAAGARFPGMRFDEAVVVHRDGGRVQAQRSLDVLHAAARAHGATTRFGVRVVGVEVGGGDLRVRVEDGRTVAADRVVVAAGAWTAGLLGDAVALPPLQVSAEQPLVFRARERDAASWLPMVHRGPHDVYGLGMPGEGVKVAEHYRDEWLDPDDRPFDLDPDATDRVAAYVRDWLPGLDPTPVLGHRCLYTTTPDKDFVLDRVDRLVVAAGFSGHGFKFTPAVGAVLADLAEGADQAVERFRLDRARTAHAGLK